MAVRTRFIDLDAGINGPGTEILPYNSMANWQSGEATAGEQDRVAKAGDTIVNIKGSEDGGFTFSGWTTSPTFRIELIVQSGSEGNGIKSSGGAGGAPYIQRSSGPGGHVWLLQDKENYLIDGFEFDLGNNSASAECIHMLFPETITIRNCLFTNTGLQALQDCITSDGGGPISTSDIIIENCIFDHANRSGIGIVHSTPGGGWTQNWTIDSCIFNENGVGETSQAAGIDVNRSGPSSGTVNVNVFNCAVFNTDAASTDGGYNDGTATDIAINWIGNDNCSDDTSCTDKFGSGSNNEDNISLVTTDTAGSYRVTDLTADAQDYTPQLVTTNDKCVNDGGTVLTVDILGNPRPGGAADDRGPFEFVASAEIFRRRIEGYK